ncbi:MAG: cytochrome b/b6 domain-containing protein [Rhodospirillales bacterium]|nr:cytochrome b/b6 domain-containing protein [Rhodospirillales bacterium]
MTVSTTTSPDTATVTTSKPTRVYIFKRFERFWHWAQALLIMGMALTGFEIHGTYALLGFEDAVFWHTTAAWTLIGLWVFAIFWHLTTGEWRHYIPTGEKLIAVAMFYAFGIFKGEHHPYKPTQLRKHNPLQLLAYLGFKLAMAPAIWITGILYLYYNDWAAWGLSWLDLETIATLHVAAAFALVIFLVGHVYLTTTGHTFFAHIKAMITGWDEQE